jgi:hypothetical protein
MGGACDTYGERRGVCRVLVGKRVGKSSLKRTRSRWVNNIKMEFKKWNGARGFN